MFARTIVGAVGLVVAGALVVGMGAMSGACAPPLPPAEPDPCNVQIVTLRVYADELINPNEQNQTRPVVVRLYQLGSDMRMLNAKYDAILLKDAETLDKDLLKVDEVEVFPNDLVEIKFERIPEAATLAGAAMFREPQGHSWKTYYEFPPMPNTPEACSEAAGAVDAGAPQAFPRTEFYLRERKIDNGNEFDASMFPYATRFRAINLPKSSAASEGAKLAGPAAPGAAPAGGTAGAAK